MKKHGSDDQRGGGDRSVSAATVEDLAFAERELAEAEACRARATVALARVRARGDGEAATGMPITQHLRWKTRVRRETVTSIGVITDVAAELPVLVAALDDGSITLDQASAVAWPAAKVSGARRRQLDGALACEDGWTRWSPEALRFEVERILADLAPALAETAETQAATQEFFALQPTLDAQGAKFHGYAHGLNAALLDQAVRDAAERPEATPADPDGVLAGRPTKRGAQLFAGLMRIVRGWGAVAGDRADDDTAGTDAPTPVTIYAIVDDTAEGSGSGELLTAARGLAPRLTARAVRDLLAQGARRVEVFTVDRELVRVAGRAGHALNDPGALSDDTTRVLCTVRDRTCRMPGCDRPVEHLHHLVWRALARARGQVSPDDPGHRAGLCQPCHQLVHRWRWAGTVGAVGRITWTRAGPEGRATVSTLGRLDQRLRPSPDDPARTWHDQNGDPLPF